MNMQTLNLARKWRSKTFETMIGQDLAIKMLKNSLYTNHYFPVYLFAGQRGCGKTSTARIFAAAVNCLELSKFQKDPKQVTIPCLQCTSCQALAAGNHPDVIEIDAASYTGVDNVRMIVESSSLLPLMGRKKIYLIDEAHMLSKAAFNAFLKILEEPPMSVLFMLATTDPHKIIDTVRSRCFQLFFRPVECDILVNHLEEICMKEHIAIDQPALQLIAKETGGSVRDALNLLEQVRFTSSAITAADVHTVLGHVDDGRLLQLLELVLHKSPDALLHALQEMKLESYSPEFLWNRWLTLLRACLWTKYHVPSPLFSEHRTQLEFLLRSIPVTRLIAMIEMLYDHELLFAKTTASYSFFEMLLLKMCQSHNNDNNSAMPLQSAPSIASAAPLVRAHDESVDDENEEEEEEEELPTDDAQGAAWKNFMKAIASLEDPLLLSVFGQAKVLAVNTQTKNITVQFPQQLSFFKNVLEESATVLARFLQEAFGDALILEAQFSGGEAKPSVAAKVQHSEEVKTISASVRTPTQAVPRPQQAMPARYPLKKASIAPVRKEPALDISDKEQWKLAHLVLQYFPGTVTEVQERS